jgi:hypothetical protein
MQYGKLVPLPPKVFLTIGTITTNQKIINNQMEYLQEVNCSLEIYIFFGQNRA